MSVEEYWIGKGIDYLELQKSYRGGIGYIEKFKSVPVHLLRIEFSYPRKDTPLFNLELIYKTIKGCFHDLKIKNLPWDEYQQAAPIFLYRIDRGSSRWDWLGELRQILTLGTTLSDAQTIGQHLENVDRKLQILNKFAPFLTPEGAAALLKAETPAEINEAIRKIVEEGLKKVQVSQKPFTGNIFEAEKTLIDLTPSPPSDNPENRLSKRPPRNRR